MDAKAKRPLSPHLQVYRPQLTSFMSIMHRITGIALSVGTLLLSCWLISLSMGQESYAKFTELFIDCWLGKLALVGWSWALSYHFLNGIRHLIWDTDHALDMKSVYRTGYIVLISSFILTALIWYAPLKAALMGGS